MTLEEMLGRGDQGGWLGRYLDDPGSLVEGFADTLTDLGSMARQLWQGSLPGLIIYAGRECHRVDGSTIALPWNAGFR